MKETTVTESQEDVTTCYLDALRIIGRSEKTLERYEKEIKMFLDYVKIPVRMVTVYHLRKYISAMKDKGLKDSTLEAKRQVFSAFFNWLQKEGIIDKNPVTNLGAIKVPKLHKKIFSEVDLEKLRQGCANIRDKAIVSFLASTGCRVSELVELNRNTVDLENLECIVHGKGDKERTVYLDSVTSMYLRNYLETRKDDCEALFANRYYNRFKTGGIRDMLNRLEEATKVEHVHPHKFRRTLATNMHKKGVPIQTISKILGHDRLETVMEYVQLNDEDTKLSYRRYAA